MSATAASGHARGDSGGLLLGLAGVTIFSMTLPMTRLAVAGLDAGFVAFGRATVAAVAAGLLLVAWRAPLPTAVQWRSLVVVAAGIVLGFPYFSSLAMRDVPAAHGAIIVGLLPLATAVCAAWFARERPSLGFWACAVAGSALVIGFALREGGGFAVGDGWMLAAVAAGAVGYAEGGRLSQTLGGARTICWALVVALPLVLPLAGWRAAVTDWQVPISAWVGFFYVALMSQLVGFFFWYGGLARGGVARVGQVQLVQPFLTVLFAVWFVGEALEPATLVFAVAVIATVALGRRTAVRRKRA